MMAPLPFTTRPEIDGMFGVIASTHWIATAVGMGILERGGNAFDAAVATAFTLQMVEPHLNGPGGDVPVILYDARTARTVVICGQGVAPRAATIARFRALGLDMVPGSGLLAACVPGTFETWMMLLRDFGTFFLRDVLEPAIFYAREGHPLVDREIRNHRHRGSAVPRALENFRRRVSARRARAATRRTAAQSRPRRHL